MKNMIKNAYREALASQAEMSEKLAVLRNPTKESVAKALGKNESGIVELLTPFTGYYSIEGGNNGFISIDTVENYFTYSQQIDSLFLLNTITVTISTDGINQKTYTFYVDLNWIFDGLILEIPNAGLAIAFTRCYKSGVLVSFEGTLRGVNIKGNTHFNPVPLSNFAGEYFLKTNKTKVLSISSTSSVQFSFNNDKELIPVPYFSYFPSMFVLFFPDHTKKDFICELMMGTAGAKGLASSIVSPNINGLLAVSIPI